jgi:predicted alpha/beta superfamily hydrolase
MKKSCFQFMCFFVFFYSNAQEMKVTSGSLKRFSNFNSDYVDARNVDVWLPDGYSNKEKYAVLYMHDGQMLFDAKTTWNKQAWEIDSIAGRLIAENKIQKFIIVGIWNNNGKRHNEYFPQKPYESLTSIQKDSISAQLIKSGRSKSTFVPISDLYLKFLVTELKPFIDKSFSTKSSRENTFIAGSSMGGLISMYAICEYPETFGGAACLSSHWPGIFTANNNPIPNTFVNYLNAKLPNPKNHKLYFDYGNKTLDSLYKPFQDKVDKVMNERGFTSRNWITKFFPDDDHSEKSWKNRVHIPLEFLLKNRLAK